MIIGIFIDAWKLSIFDRRLTKGGFPYTKGPGLTEGTLLLQVTAAGPDVVAPVIMEAERESKRTGMN